jgi:methyl-accepting chemotaxis protein-1 (serine sensor receptor)
MASVTHAVARVTDIMGEIAAASAEQSRGIEQVNQAITQMDEVTQQNAALVEEAAAASQSLETQGRQLNDAVALFRVTQQLSPRQPTASLASAGRGNSSDSTKKSVASLPPKTRSLVAAGNPSEWESF